MPFLIYNALGGVTEGVSCEGLIKRHFPPLDCTIVHTKVT